MEPDRSGGTEQTSPRGNDWEVVQLTASTYASSPGAGKSEPSDEEAEAAKEYGTDGGDSAAALLMSGHFSVSQNEVLSDSKERQEARGSQDAVPNKGDEDDDDGDDDRHEEKLKDGLDRIPSFDNGKSFPLVDTESDDGGALRAMSLIGEEPVEFSSPGDSTATDAEKELSLSGTDSKTEKKTEEPALPNLNPVTGSSKAVVSGEQNKPDGSRVPDDAWWRKQLISLYKSAKGSNKLWPVVVAAAALMGMAYFRRRWQKGRLQLQQVKLQTSSSKERINHAVGPLNRIKDILAAGNHPSPATNGHARLS